MKVLLSAVLLIAAATPALADPNITINKCAVSYVTKGDDSVIGYGVDFTNNTHHTVTAIRFNVTFETPFNEVLGNTLQTDSGQFVPGAEIDHTERDVTSNSVLGGGISVGSVFGARRGIKEPYWQVKNPSNQPIDQMKAACTLDAVSFQDGTVWTAPVAPAAK